MIFLVKIFSKNSDVSFKHLIQALQHRNGNMYCNDQGHHSVPRGGGGGGGGGGGPTEPNILHPKKYKTGNFRPGYVQIIRIMLSDLAGTLA